MNTHRPKYINIKGKLLDLSTPQIMGIVNVTPDSFYDGSRAQTEREIIEHTAQLLEHNTAIIDLGAYSSRPGADNISAEEEMKRLATGLTLINKHFPGTAVSIDTFRAEVAERCVSDYGADIINDITGGAGDEQMFETVARLQVPYVLMHMKGTPQTMQQHATYDNFIREVFIYFAERVDKLRRLGAKDIIIDPGFGFAKTMAHNYELMARMEEFEMFDLPVLAGVSRKSMIYRLLETTPQEALNGTTVLNTIALTKGANILRVHDAREAAECIRIVSEIEKYQTTPN